jgi:hypothetical protein
MACPPTRVFAAQNRNACWNVFPNGGAGTALTSPQARTVRFSVSLRSQLFAQMLLNFRVLAAQSVPTSLFCTFPRSMLLRRQGSHCSLKNAVAAQVGRACLRQPVPTHDFGVRHVLSSRAFVFGGVVVGPRASSRRFGLRNVAVCFRRLGPGLIAAGCATLWMMPRHPVGARRALHPVCGALSVGGGGPGAKQQAAAPSPAPGARVGGAAAPNEHAIPGICADNARQQDGLERRFLSARRGRLRASKSGSQDR